MTRTQHYAHPTKSFPVYCLDWTDDDTVLLGGGGGATKSGIANKFKLCRVANSGQNVEDVFELNLSSDEDAPMTLALDRGTSQLVTGINQSESSLKAGKNANCRVFSYKDNEISPVRSQQTLDAPYSDDYPYQKITALSSKSGSSEFVAVGTTDNKVSILQFPSLSAITVINPEGGDLVDLDWGGPNGTWLAITTSTKLAIYEFEAGEKDLVPRLELSQSIDAPVIDDTKVEFRAARFFTPSSTPSSNDSNLSIFAVLNAVLPKRGQKKGQRKAYIARYEASELPGQDGDEKDTPKYKWDLTLKRDVAGKPITVLDISKNGLVAFGASDLSIGVLDAKTLSPLLKILQVHSFPPTALKFNPSATMIVSASADNTIRTIVVPSSFGGVSFSVIAFIIAVILVIVAFLLQHSDKV